MYNIKTLLAAAAMTVAMAAGVSGANAAPWDHQDHRQIVRQEVRQDVRRDVRQDLRFDHVRRPIIVRERVFDSLRLHHYRGVADPIFIHGHYVVRSFNHFGQVVFVEVDPYTGAFLGEFRA